MTLTSRGPAATGFAACACSHPAERAELTATKITMNTRKVTHNLCTTVRRLAFKDF
jgi:hypothetical protein